MPSLTNPEIGKFLDCSTGHIKWEDSKLLPLVYSPLSCYSYEYGMFVHTCIGSELPEEPALKFGFSQALLDVLKIGAHHQCNFIKFDADGMEYPELPSFEWPDNDADALVAVKTERLDIPMIMSRLADPVALSIIERRLKGEDTQAWATMRQYQHLIGAIR